MNFFQLRLSINRTSLLHLNESQAVKKPGTINIYVMGWSEPYTQRQTAKIHKRDDYPPIVGRLCYTSAFGNGRRNFEPWSSDVDDT
ncbi:hypothetical protein TNCV_1113401 [Trichonephila clavipes]|nr:hypothetical protein TNCV_1113401 [Trichonephila clavipes]